MEQLDSLRGQVAVISGAGRGIGAAIARRLAALGATTVLCGRTRTLLESTAAALARNGGQTEMVECDVRDLGSVEALDFLRALRGSRFYFCRSSLSLG